MGFLAAAGTFSFLAIQVYNAFHAAQQGSPLSHVSTYLSPATELASMTVAH